MKGGEAGLPELPEVETMVRGIRPHVEGRVIGWSRRCRCRLKPLTISPSSGRVARAARGRRIESVRRIAKRVVLDLEGDESIVIEPRMTGLMLLADPPTTAHLRYHWRLEGPGEYSDLWFWDRRGLGTIRLYAAGEIGERLGPGVLGPDALSMTASDWRRLCSQTGRAIKVALLDQSFVAGIGNLYASEILHRARIDPAGRADSLDAGQVRRLARAVRNVLEQAIRYEGSTLGDGTYRNALSRSGRYQHQHQVYGRAGEPCRRCGAEVLRIVQAQRSTFFCPACQAVACQAGDGDRE